MLRPGGTVAFCGEPSRYGDRLAALPKRAGHARRAALAARWSAPRPRGSAPTAEREDGHELEPEVDVHAFAPADLRAAARATAGFEDVRVRGEELLANVYGWRLRTLEATAEPDEVPWRWRQLRLPQLPRPAAPRRRAARAAAAGRSSSTTSSLSARKPA